jgi:hypothetical protein
MEKNKGFYFFERCSKKGLEYGSGSERGASSSLLMTEERDRGEDREDTENLLLNRLV